MEKCMVATDGPLRLRRKKEEGETMGAGVAWHQEADMQRERGKSPRRERDPWDTKGERDKPATEGRGAAKCEQKGCGQLVKHKGAAGSNSTGSQDSAYRDGLDNPNRQRGSDHETDVVSKKGLQATPQKDEGLRYSARK